MAAKGTKVYGPYLKAGSKKVNGKTVKFWQATIQMKGPNGTQASRGRRFNTESKVEAKREASLWLEEVREEVRRAEELVPVDGDIPEFVSKRIEEWSVGKQASTLHSYRKDARMLKGLKGVTLEELDADMISQWRDDLLDHGATDGGPLSPATVRKGMALLRRALNDALAMHNIDQDPMMGVSRPEDAQGDKLDAEGNAVNTADTLNELDAEGRTKTLAMIDTVRPDGYARAIVLAIYTGMRRGELLALQWRDIDLVAGLIHVRRAVGECKKGTQGVEKSTFLKVPKKTRGKYNNSIRDIPILDDLGNYLSEWHERDLSACSSRGLELSGESYVLGDPTTGTRAAASNLSGRVKAFFYDHEITGITGEEPSLHDLRRTFRGWIEDELEVPEPVRRYYMGHAGVSVDGRHYSPFNPEYHATMKAKAEGRMRVSSVGESCD